MSTYTDLRDGTVGRVQLVADVGLVYARPRFAGDWSTYLNMFKTEIQGISQIRAWTISRDELNVEPDRYSADMETYQFVVRGFMSFDDERDTDGLFNDLIDEVVHSLNGRKDLDSSAVVDYAVGPASLRVNELRAFGSVLCHYCEIPYPIEVQRVVTYA